MYDTKLTEKPFCGTKQLKRSCRRIYTAEGKLVGGLTNRQIYDLNGQTLAKAIERKKRINDSGESERVVVYRGKAPRGNEDEFERQLAEPYTADGEAVLFERNEDEFERQPAEPYSADGEAVLSERNEAPRGNEDETEFQLIGNRVYRNGEYVGVAEGNRRSGLLIIGPSLTALIALILAFILLLILLIDTPNVEPTVISVRDDNGYWGEGKIAVLGDEVSPGQNGSYSFVIENPHDEELSYSFQIQAVYNGETLSEEYADKFPLLFRLKMNNAYIVTTGWLTVERLFYTDMVFLANTKQSFALEWEWPFENGHDDLDTRYGIENGEMALTLNLTAETVK